VARAVCQEEFHAGDNEVGNAFYTEGGTQQVGIEIVEPAVDVEEKRSSPDSEAWELEGVDSIDVRDTGVKGGKNENGATLIGLAEPHKTGDG